MISIHLILIICIYSIFGFFAFVEILNNIKKLKKITIMSLCKLMYILTLFIIPIIIYVEYLYGKKETTFAFALSYNNKNIWTLYCVALYTIIGYLMFLFGYKIKQKKSKERKKVNQSKMVLLITVLTICSIFSLFIWSSGFGGVKQLIINANSIRAGYIVSTGNKAFFKHFVPMSMIVSYISYEYLFIQKKYKSIKEILYIFVLFVISVITSILYILANDGRMLAGVYLGLFFLLKIKDDYEIKQKEIIPIITKSLVLLGILLIIVINADSVFNLIKGEKIITTTVEANSNYMSSIASEFLFTLVSAQEAILMRVNGIAKYTIWNDLINGIFAWLPTSLKPVALVDVWDYNTTLINTGVHGQIPNSIISQSIYDLGVIGVFVIPFIYGMIIKKMERIFESNKEDLFYRTIYIVLGYFLAKGIPYFSFYNIMMNTFFIVAACIIYKILKLIKFERS